MKSDKSGRVKNALVIIHHQSQGAIDSILNDIVKNQLNKGNNGNVKNCNALFEWSSFSQKVLLQNNNMDSEEIQNSYNNGFSGSSLTSYKSIIIVDITSLFPKNSTQDVINKVLAEDGASQVSTCLFILTFNY
jgi:hypothetical protein